MHILYYHFLKSFWRPVCGEIIIKKGSMWADEVRSMAHKQSAVKPAYLGLYGALSADTAQLLVSQSLFIYICGVLME